MKKIKKEKLKERTDTERLNWLENTRQSIVPIYMGLDHIGWRFRGRDCKTTNIREGIDRIIYQENYAINKMLLAGSKKDAKTS